MREFSQIRLVPDGRGGLVVFATLPGRQAMFPLDSIQEFAEWLGMVDDDEHIPASRRCGPDGLPDGW